MTVVTAEHIVPIVTLVILVTVGRERAVVMVVKVVTEVTSVTLVIVVTAVIVWTVVYVGTLVTKVAAFIGVPIVTVVTPVK